MAERTLGSSFSTHAVTLGLSLRVGEWFGGSGQGNQVTEVLPAPALLIPS
jgi:hypothetical protein